MEWEKLNQDIEQQTAKIEVRERDSDEREVGPGPDGDQKDDPVFTLSDTAGESVRAW